MRPAWPPWARWNTNSWPVRFGFVFQFESCTLNWGFAFTFLVVITKRSGRGCLAVLNPDLEVDHLALEREVFGGHALDGLGPDDPAADDLLHEDVVRFAVEEIGSGRVDLEMLAQLVDRAVDVGGASTLS